jgi:hypothetical protein
MPDVLDARAGAATGLSVSLKLMYFLSEIIVPDRLFGSLIGALSPVFTLVQPQRSVPKRYGALAEAGSSRGWKPIAC